MHISETAAPLEELAGSWHNLVYGFSDSISSSHTLKSSLAPPSRHHHHAGKSQDNEPSAEQAKLCYQSK